MNNFYIKELNNEDIVTELQRIGFDKGYCFMASDKFRYKNIKIYNLSVAQANIIKQTALTVGADLATHKDVVTGNADLSDAILCGSYSQLRKIASKLKLQPFELKELGEIIENSLIQQKRETSLVGILNITPDSFSDGGKYMETSAACEHLVQMIKDGADMIDIGAESTRPNSAGVEPAEQIIRLHPVLEFVQKENIKIPISVDTRSSEVADFALNNGVQIINDVSGFEYDGKLPEVVAKYDAGVVIQHSKGTPDVMQNSPVYENLIDEVYSFLKTKSEYAKSLGINEIIIDPGIGFGKTKEDNLEILNRIDEFYSLRLPVMVGVSRKSFLGVSTDDNDLKDKLTLAVSYPLIFKKVDYLRVHNVKLHKALMRNLF